MNKGMNILYQVHNNLYVNLTNRCPCACTFCLRQTMDSVAADDATLWLEHEPEVEEVIAGFDKFDMSVYDEVVFCGYGEQTERLDVLLSVAKYVKEHFHKPIRINTNGLANLIWEKDVTRRMHSVIMNWYAADSVRNLLTRCLHLQKKQQSMYHMWCLQLSKRH